jgi:S1-C subfamily serine protease
MKLIRINILNYILVILLTFVVTWYFISSDENKLVLASEKTIPSVVTIASRNDSFSNNKSGFGSGVIFSDDGYIVTNLHIISGQNIDVTLHNGNNYNASIIGVDKNTDIAVLKISSNEKLNAINFANSDNLKTGDRVLAIGNPYGIGLSVSNGIISASGRDYGNPYLQLIQTDAAINPGNSGGALINENGNLIGINSKIFSRTGAYQGIGFAIPSNLVVQTATQLIRYGKVNTLWIGKFRVAKVKLNFNKTIIDGLRVVEIESSGPLYEKGVRTNDIIISINGETANWNNLIKSLQFATLGEALNINLIDQNKKFLEIQF